MFRSRSAPPVCFLDIDGVLAPFDRRQPGLEPVRVGGYYGTLLVSPSIIARIRDLHRARVIEVRWLTSWEDDANTCLAPLVGLDTYPVHHEPDGPMGERYWKETVVRDHAQSGQRFVWIDDEMTFYNSHVTVSADHGEQGLVIAPDSLTGLTHAQVDMIERFLDEA